MKRVYTLLLCVFLYPYTTYTLAYAATRLGLQVTVEELAVWRSRANNGPYKTLGDLSPNSPADWTRIVTNKDSFRSDPSQGRWAGDVNWTVGTCITNQKMSDAAFPGDNSRTFGDKVRDAGFFSLVANTDSTAADAASKVRTFLLGQAQTAKTKWQDKTTFCEGTVIGDGNPRFDLATWMFKLLQAYEYIDIKGGVLSTADKAIIDPWFIGAGEYIRSFMHGTGPSYGGHFGTRFITAEAEFETTVAVGGVYSSLSTAFNTCPMNNGSDPTFMYNNSLSHSDDFSDMISNRGMTQAAFFTAIGVKYNKPELLRHGKMFWKTVVTYATMPDGSSFELKRGHDAPTTDEERGFGYWGIMMGPMAVMADVLARNGDTDLYEYTTSSGVCQISGSNAGGPRSLKTILESMVKYMDHTFVRFIPGFTSGSNNIIDGDSLKAGCRKVEDLQGLVIGNHWYNSTYIKNAYLRQPTGGPVTIPGYTTNPCSSGGVAFNGTWGSYPGILLYFANTESLNVYNVTPDVETDIEIRIPFEENVGNIAHDTIGDRDAVLQGGYTWVPGIVGNTALQLNNPGDSGTIDGLLNDASALTLAAHVQLLTNNPNGGTVINVGNFIGLRVYEGRVRGFTWNGTSFTGIDFFGSVGFGWNHVAYVHTGTVHKLYLNGTLVTSINAPAINWSTGPSGLSNVITLGKHAAGDTSYNLHGKLDEVRIYNRALTDADIAGLVSAGTPGVSLAISSPVSGGTYNTTSTTVSFTGIANDTNGSITAVTWTCPTCTPTNGTATGTTAWVINSIGLALGNNIVTITATDNSGNTASQQVTVVRTNPTTPPVHCDYYASNSGSGNRNGLSQANAFQVINFWPVATPGKTLCLLDGNYSGGNSLIQSPASFAGTASQRITIRALNDGKVTINGGSNYPVWLQGKFGILEGIDAFGGSNVTCMIPGTDWIVRRVVCWQLNPPQNNNISTSSGKRNLYEDFASFGSGRKAFQLGQFGRSDNIGRRIWARYEQCPTCGSGNGTDAAEIGYDQTHILAENLIANWRQSGPTTSPEAPILFFATTDSRLLGSIAYQKIGHTGDNGPLVSVYDTGGTQGLSHAVNARNTLRDVVGIIQPGHSQFGKQGVRIRGTGGTGNVAQNIYSISGGAGECPNNAAWSCSGFRQGSSVANALAGTGHSNIWTAVPGICKRYVNGTLTNQGLWPWPMNQRIKDALAKAARPTADVTQDMIDLFGPIPSQCLSETETEPPPTPVATSFTFLGASILNGNTCPALLTPFRVQALDQFGSVYTNSVIPIQASFNTNPGNGTLIGDTTVPTVNGIAEFNNLCVDTAADNYQLKFTHLALTQALSNTFNVTELPVEYSLVFNVEPTRVGKGEIITPPVVVHVTDQSGELINDSTASVTIAVAPGFEGVTLNGTTVKNAVNGVVVFDDLTVDNRVENLRLAVSATDIVTEVSGAFAVRFPVGITPANPNAIGVPLMLRRY